MCSHAGINLQHLIGANCFSSVCLVHELPWLSAVTRPSHQLLSSPCPHQMQCYIHSTCLLFLSSSPNTVHCSVTLGSWPVLSLLRGSFLHSPHRRSCFSESILSAPVFPGLFHLLLFSTFHLLIFVGEAGATYSTCVEVRRQPAGVSSFLPWCGL